MKLGELKELNDRIYALLRRESILALGRTAPNPAVACVVIARCGGRYHLFSGGTEKAGGRHAEIVALDRYDDFRSHNAVDSLSLYVTLEPCSSRGRTPPCTDRLLAYPELRRVIVCRADDSQPRNGIEILRSGRIRTSLHVANDGGRKDGKISDAGFFVEGFLKRIQSQGPRLHLKAAITADGFMSRFSPERLLITGERANRFTMLLRSRLDAVLVGAGTSALDLPGLELRTSPQRTLPLMQRMGGADPFCDALAEFTSELEELSSRIDYQPGRLFMLGRPFESYPRLLTKQKKLAELTGREPVFVTTEKHREVWQSERPGIDILPDSSQSEFAKALREWLGSRGYNEVLIEGGPDLLSDLEDHLEAGDRIYILQSRNHVLNRPGTCARGKKIPPALRRLPDRARYDLGGDVLFVKEIGYQDRTNR